MMRRFSIFLFFSLLISLMFSSCKPLEEIIPNNVLPCKDCPPPEGVSFLLDQIDIISFL